MPASLQLEDNVNNPENSSHNQLLKSATELLTMSCKSTLFAMLFESQSSPSYSTSPEAAHVLWIYLQDMIHTGLVIHAPTWSQIERKKMIYITSGAGEESEGQACQLSQQHSLHLEDLAC